MRLLSQSLQFVYIVKKTRNKEDHWEEVDAYKHDSSQANFNNIICPQCIKLIYSRSPRI
jgi:hypothetical protein